MQNVLGLPKREDKLRTDANAFHTVTAQRLARKTEHVLPFPYEAKANDDGSYALSLNAAAIDESLNIFTQEMDLSDVDTVRLERVMCMIFTDRFPDDEALQNNYTAWMTFSSDAAVRQAASRFAATREYDVRVNADTIVSIPAKQFPLFYTVMTQYMPTSVSLSVDNKTFHYPGTLMFDTTTFSLRLTTPHVLLDGPDATMATPMTLHGVDRGVSSVLSPFNKRITMSTCSIVNNNE